MKKNKEYNSDHLLWEGFKQGDNRAFFLIYDQFSDALFKYGLHFCRDICLIEDCIHDLFLDLYKYREGLTEIENIRFYLLCSMRRLISKAMYKKNLVLTNKKILLQNTIPVMSFEDDIIALESENEDHWILIKVVKKLSDRQQEGLFLKFEQNLSYIEIAGILGISVESARTSIYRTLKELREMLEAPAK